MAAGQIYNGFGGAGKDPLGSMHGPEQYAENLASLAGSPEKENSQPGRVRRVLAAVGIRGASAPETPTQDPSSAEQSPDVVAVAPSPGAEMPNSLPPLETHDMVDPSASEAPPDSQVPPVSRV